MGAAISVLLSLAVFIIKLHIKVLLFLIKRFDITNSLIVGMMLETLTQNLEINIWIKVITIAIIVAGCVLLQNLFYPIRVVFAIVGTIFCWLIVCESFNVSFVSLTSFISLLFVGLLNGFSLFKTAFCQKSKRQEI